MTTRPIARAWFAAGLTTLVVAAVAASVAGQQRDTRVGAPTPADRGTASVSGVVVDAQSSAPVRRAIVTLQGPGEPSTRSLVTDDAGRFRFESLPPERYSLVATKAAYIDAAYGATRPGRPGTALQIAEGQQLDVTIAIARGAVIEGVIRDETGAPVPRVAVYVLDPREANATMGSPIFGGGARQRRTTTDDRGAYRLFGLTPGDYVVGTSIEPAGEGEIARRAAADIDAMIAALEQSRGRGRAAPPVAPSPRAPAVGYAPVFYPGVTVFADATRIRLGAAEERRGIDFTLAPVPTSIIEGTITRADGQSAPIQLSLAPDGPMLLGATSRPILSQPPGPDGRFRYTSVPPGRYRVLARSEPAAPGRGRGGSTVVFMGGGPGVPPPPPPPPPPPGVMSAPGLRSYAMAEVAVAGQDVVGVSLVLQPGVTVDGRVVFDASTGEVSEMPSDIRVSFGLPGGSYFMNSRDGTQIGTGLFSAPAVGTTPEGTFFMHGAPPGSYQLRASIPSDVDGEWWLRSAMLDGRDLLDEPLEIGTTNRSGIVLTYTDRRNALSGAFQTAAGQPATDYFVVAFPADRALWQEGSRRFVSARPATDGRFRIVDLPAGSYLMAALTDFEPSDFGDASYLETLAAQAIPVVIRDGEETVQDIRVAR